MSSYDAPAYWSQRLGAEPNLRATGMVGLSPGFNRWLYRRKSEVLRSVIADRARSAVALDAGCGAGWGTRLLLECGAQVTACDLVPAAVERAASLPGVDAFRHELGAEALPLADASVDVAISVDVLYHVVDDAQWAAAVTELARVLRPGGTLVVTDWYGDGDLEPAAHVRLRSRARWLGLASELGMRVVADEPLQRWLAREPIGVVRRLTPGYVLGALEYGLERVAPEPAHTRCVVFELE